MTATRNQVFQHDMEARRIIGELMEKHGRDRTKIWREFGPILSRMRLQSVNKKIKTGFGLLNGQPTLRDFWQCITISRNQANLLLIFTDGLIYYPDSENEQCLVQKVLNLYRQGGLQSVLEETRKKESAEKEISHIDHAEATAIAVEF